MESDKDHGSSGAASMKSDPPGTSTILGGDNSARFNDGQGPAPPTASRMTRPPLRQVPANNPSIEASTTEQGQGKAAAVHQNQGKAAAVHQNHGGLDSTESAASPTAADEDYVMPANGQPWGAILFSDRPLVKAALESANNFINVVFQSNASAPVSSAPTSPTTMHATKKRKLTTGTTATSNSTDRTQDYSTSGRNLMGGVPQANRHTIQTLDSPSPIEDDLKAPAAATAAGPDHSDRSSIAPICLLESVTNSPPEPSNDGKSMPAHLKSHNPFDRPSKRRAATTTTANSTASDYLSANAPSTKKVGAVIPIGNEAEAIGDIGKPVEFHNGISVDDDKTACSIDFVSHTESSFATNTSRTSNTRKMLPAANVEEAEAPVHVQDYDEAAGALPPVVQPGRNNNDAIEDVEVAVVCAASLQVGENTELPPGIESWEHHGIIPESETSKTWAQLKNSKSVEHDGVVWVPNRNLFGSGLDVLKAGDKLVATTDNYRHLLNIFYVLCADDFIEETDDYFGPPIQIGLNQGGIKIQTGA